MDENLVSVLDVVNHPFMPPNTKSAEQQPAYLSHHITDK